MSNPMSIHELGAGALSRLNAAPIQTPGTHTEPAAQGQDFKSVLMESLEEVNRLQGEADQRVHSLVAGRTDNVAEVFAAVNKAGIAFNLLMEVRNKLVEAYRDIQQMRV